MQFQQLKALLERHQLWAKKSLGQHFLHDEGICQRMVRHLHLRDEVIVEVGPGPGSLTDILLKEEPKFLLLIEKDQRFIEILKGFKPAENTSFEIEPADALKVSVSNILKKHEIITPYHIVANLPYNIGTELLIRWIDDIKAIASITVMLQKEVVDRIKARVGTKDYGRLAIIMQSCFEVQEMFQISPQAFIPPPKVWSSVVFLKPKEKIPSKEVLKKLEKLTAKAFSQRRKMLRATLGKALPLTLWQNLCTTIGIDETMRPEELSAQIFLAMAELCSTEHP